MDTYANAARDESMVDDDMFQKYTDLIYRQSGIRLGQQKRGLLTSRLLKRLRATGAGDYRAYYRRIKEDSDELIEMLNCISTNTTEFFREPHHFKFLTGPATDALRSTRGAERCLRIWSAGCSSGEEPYSIAIAMLETFGPEWDIKILATDISTNVLSKASVGVYEREQLPADLDAEIVKKYFLKGEGAQRGTVMAKEGLKRHVTFERLNLKEPSYPFKRPFDIIFCRNVMIYFDEPMKNHVLTRFHEHLASDGYLFLGHSESMQHMDKYRPVFVTTYTKR